jgi:membrane-bound ClpP family serine protease
MFWTILLLLFLGLVLILLEVLLPYGISFIAGVFVIGVAVYKLYQEDPRSGMALLMVALPVAGGLAWYVFRSGIRLVSLEPPAADPTPAGPPDGASVTVSQTLRPTGTVTWEKGRYAARTVQIETEIPAGRRVRVVGRESIYLLVKPEDGDG